jgi:hypothetical protein
MQLRPNPDENRRMEDGCHNVYFPDLPSSKAIRRFWIAWLVLLVAMLAGLIIIVLIATVVGAPAHISPAG